MHGAHRDAVHGRFEHDHGVSAVVRIRSMDFALSAEISIMAHRALVSNTSDKTHRPVFAQGAVAKDTKVYFI
jgi:hypothetical protein